MSFDRPDIAADEAADVPHAGRSTEVTSAAATAKELPGWKLTAEDRIEAHRRARETADAAYAAWDRAHADAGTSAQVPGTVRERPGTPTDKPSTTEALRKRLAELEADKAVQDAKLTAQAKTIAEQGERIERLEAYVGRITTAVHELRQQDESQPSTEIAERAGGKQADRAKPQQKRRIPTDAMNNVISVAAGGAITDLAYHLRDLPPEYAGVGASGLALGAGLISVWRERRKGGDDADRRPKG